MKMMQRILAATASLAVAVSLSARAAVTATAPAATTGVEHGVVFEREGTYACFPSLVDLGDGRLVTEFGTRIRPSHIDFRGGTQKRVTRDGGATWQSFEGSIVNPQWKSADGVLRYADADGWIHVPEAHIPQLEREQRYFYKNAGPGLVAYLGGASSRMSTDGGRTWTKEPIPLPDYITGLMHYHDDVSRLRTMTGVRLTAVYAPRRGQPKHADEVYFLRSGDDGRTWSFIPMFPQGLPDPKLGFNEAALAELPGGRVIAVMRSNPEGYLWQSISDDQGQTWSTPRRTEIWGFPCDLLVLNDGRLLCVYGHRRNPKGIRASLSTDGGQTWNVANEMILRDDAKGGGSDLGYPRVAQLADGRLLTVYYMVTDGTNRRVHVAWSRWSVPPAIPTPSLPTPVSRAAE